MKCLLLLVDADGTASAHALRVRQLREFPGAEGVSVHFRPVRNDVLFQSAKIGSSVAYRVLFGEGIVRSQLWVEYEVGGPPVNVTGRSADLLFALALTTSMWKKAEDDYPVIAATGVLNADDTIASPDPVAGIAGVEHIEAKLAAALDALAGEQEGIIFYPAANQDRVAQWRAAAVVPSHIQVVGVSRLDDAFSALGIELEKVYLGNPYRGLECFEYAHRSVFFGRESEIQKLLAQLLRRATTGAPGVLVEGASGSGKSSFLRAGILPALVNPRLHSPELESAFGTRRVSNAVGRAIWHPALLPECTDESAFSRSIHRVWQRLPEFAVARPAQVATFQELLCIWRTCWPADRLFVWVVDQLEELFTLGLSEALIEAFGHFLLALQAEGAWTLASIRADATSTLKRSAALRTVFGSNEGQYYLTTLGPTALDDVICRPAKAAGLSFDVDSRGKRLDQTLREDAYRDHENALPLLQLMLHELYERRVGRELTYAAYEELGGLSGAVATIASAALRGASQDAIIASRLFRSLVSVDESGTAIRRYAPRSEVAEDPAQELLLAALVNARLCVTDQREGHSVVALAHEAVLRTWPELVDWLTEESRLLQLRDLAERDARLWHQQECSGDWLATPSKLAALEPLESAGVRLSEPVNEFVARSRERVRRIARLRRAGVAAAVLLAVAASVSAVIAVSKQHEAQHEAARALRAKNRATIEADTARATAKFLTTIFNAPTPERSLGRLITARELLDAGARRLRTSLITAPEVRARLTEQIGNAYREIGEYGRAAPLLANAVKQYRVLANAPLKDRAEAYTALAQLYEATDKRSRASKTLDRAMALEAELPASHRSAMPELVYAKLEIDAAHFPLAEAALNRARRILRSRAHAPDRENYLILMRYSRLYEDQGELKKARQFGVLALATESRIFGLEDPFAIATEDNLERIYQATNNVTAAEKYGRRALILAKRIYGENHPVYAHELGNYAINFGILGERGVKGANEKAARLFRQVLRIRLRTLGPHNSATGDAYYDIANARAVQGRWAEALPLIQRARKIWESSDGRNSPRVAWALSMEARALTHLGRPADAVPLALRALRISERAHVSQYTGSAWDQLGKAYLALDRYSHAVAAFRRSIAIATSVFGHSNKLVANLLDNDAKALEDEHRFAAAKTVLEQAATIRNNSRNADLPENHLKSN